MSDELRAWLSEEIKQRGWSQRELARRSEISYPLISQVLSGDISPSADFCIKVAQALDLSPVLLLVKAGILPPQEPNADDITIQELIELARNLSPEDRQELLDYARFKHRRKRKD